MISIFSCMLCRLASASIKGCVGVYPMMKHESLVIRDRRFNHAFDNAKSKAEDTKGLPDTIGRTIRKDSD